MVNGFPVFVGGKTYLKYSGELTCNNVVQYDLTGNLNRRVLAAVLPARNNLLEWSDSIYS